MATSLKVDNKLEPSKKMAKAKKVYLISFILINIYFLIWVFFGGEVFSYWSALIYLYGVVACFLWVFKGRQFVIFVCILLLVFEVGLIQLNFFDSYSERNGSNFYVMPYYGEIMLKQRLPNEEVYERKSEFSMEYTSNSWGFRDEETPKDFIKIILVGDSFIEGLGATANYTPDKLLEQKLSCKGCVLNMGLGGSDLFFSHNMLRNLENERHISPQLVILNLNASDVNDVISRSKDYGIRSIEHPSFLYQAVYGGSHTLRLILTNVFGIGWDLYSKEKTRQYEQIAKEEIWKEILQYQTELSKKRIEFLVVLQPFKYELKNNNYGLEIIKKHLSQRNDINAIDVSPLFEANPNSLDSLYWPVDMHFNNKGYKKFIDYIYAETNKKYPELWSKVLAH